MQKKITKAFAGLAALAALALGGAAIASAGQGGSVPRAPAVEQQAGAKADTDSIQDENGKDDASEPAGSEKASGGEQADTDSIQDENGKDDATETAGSEQESVSEATESGSEAPGNDGPGGHADEPGNPNADHQFEGKE